MILVQAYFQAKLYSYIASKDTPHNYNNDERKLILHQKYCAVTIKIQTSLHHVATY